MSGWRTVRKPLFLVAYGAAMVALFLGGLRLVDTVVGRRLAGKEIAPDYDRLSIRTLELFPFDGFHVQANFRHRGPMPWNDHAREADFDVRTGDKGYFVDFSLEDPPPKAADEFRIVLIGGSGAQGWGATSNEKMFYTVLERELNRRFSGRGIRVRVVNLAMGSSFTYQNFISLNLWAHALEPDLILAYVGRNDFFVPLEHEGGADVFYFFDKVSPLAMAARGSEYPERMGWLMDFLPNIMRRTSLGLGLKVALGWDHFRTRSQESYLKARGQRIESRRQVLEENVTPLLIHALKSIKRDFGGVPVMVGWQPVRIELKMLGGHLGADFYDRMYERTRRELDGYLNDRWFFINFQEVGRAFPGEKFECHLDDSAHAIVGNILAGRIEQIMPALLAERGQRQARGLPPYGK